MSADDFEDELSRFLQKETRRVGFCAFMSLWPAIQGVEPFRGGNSDISGEDLG